jgi:signal peptidase
VLLGAAIALGFLLMIWKRRKKTKNEGDIVSMTQQPEEAKRRKAKEPAGKKIKRIILDVLLAVAILAVVSAAVSAIFFNNEDTFLLGYKPYIVSSESMAPAYRKYAVVLVKNQTYDEVEPGELIAFRADELGGKPAFHRVVEITPDGFITKGDANKINDGQVVDREAFLGRRVWHTNLTADLIPLLMTPKGFIFIIVLPVLLIFLIIIFIKVLQIARKNNRKPARAHPRHLSRPDSGQVKDIDSDSEVHED